MSSMKTTPIFPRCLLENEWGAEHWSHQHYQHYQGTSIVDEQHWAIEYCPFTLSQSDYTLLIARTIQVCCTFGSCIKISCHRLRGCLVYRDEIDWTIHKVLGSITHRQKLASTLNNYCEDRKALPNPDTCSVHKQRNMHTFAQRTLYLRRLAHRFHKSHMHLLANWISWLVSGKLARDSFWEKLHYLVSHMPQAQGTLFSQHSHFLNSTTVRSLCQGNIEQSSVPLDLINDNKTTVHISIDHNVNNN